MFFFQQSQILYVFLPISKISDTSAKFSQSFVSLLFKKNNITFDFLKLFPPKSSLHLVYMWFGMTLTVDPLSCWNSTSFFLMFINALILRDATSFTCCTDKTSTTNYRYESSESNVSVYSSCTCFFSLLSFLFQMFSHSFDFRNSLILLQIQVIYEYSQHCNICNNGLSLFLSHWLKVYRSYILLYCPTKNSFRALSLLVSSLKYIKYT